MRVRTNRRYSGFTLTELLVVVAIIALLISILMPSFGRARERAKRTCCASNLKGIATAAAMYAHDNSGWWPMAASDVSMGANVATPLTNTMGGHALLARNRESSIGTGSPNRAVSNSRSLWLMVRGLLVSSQQFICPSSSEDIAEPADESIRFYDFKGYGYLSYAYQNTLYRRVNSALPRENRDPRMVLLADKSPFFTRGTVEANESGGLSSGSYAASASSPDVPAFTQTLAGLPDPDPDNGFDQPFAAAQTPDQQRYNSPNHGGRDEGEGQNIARPDSSVDFVLSPTVGVRGDNIYTPAYHTPDSMVGFWSGTAPGLGRNVGVPGYQVFRLQRAGPTPISTTSVKMYNGGSVSRGPRPFKNAPFDSVLLN